MKKIKYLVILAALGVAVAALGAVLFDGSIRVGMLVGGIMATVIGVVGSVMIVKDSKSEQTPEYRRKTALLTPPEQEFIELLKGVEPKKYEVLPQIVLAAVIDKKAQSSYRNELFRIADFCFVDKDTYEPLLLVELNDKSHLRADRKERDEKVAEICRKAGLPLITFWTDEHCDFRTVRQRVLKNILKR